MRQTKIDEFIELEDHNKKLEKRIKEEVSNTKRKQKYRQGKGKDRKKEWLKYLYNLTYYFHN